MNLNSQMNRFIMLKNNKISHNHSFNPKNFIVFPKTMAWNIKSNLFVSFFSFQVSEEAKLHFKISHYKKMSEVKTLDYLEEDRNTISKDFCVFSRRKSFETFLAVHIKTELHCVKSS
jgi:hypothetical protein